MPAKVLQRSLPFLIAQLVTVVCLFVPAGRLSWWRAWVLLATSLLAGLAASVVMSRDPQLAAERRNYRAGKGWDKLIVPFVVLVGPAATWITAGLDVRHSWSDEVPAWTFVGGLAAAALGAWLVVAAMRANTFFSSIVRIQNDRGHRVVTGGPYRFVRHPGYAGMSAFMLATPLILGSWWAFIPATATVALSVLRTALEDRTLQRELAGYSAYAGTVRYRLLPLVW